jgi:hypothetical protein
LTLDASLREGFFAALHDAGIPRVPQEFSVTPCSQLIRRALFLEVARFIRVFDEVTNRESWQAKACQEVFVTQPKRREICFFSAWDFHLTAEGGFKLIEFNDNGSGFLFANIINALYWEAAGFGANGEIAAPASLPQFRRQIADFVEQEARAFFGEIPQGLFLILDDEESLRRGKFRQEHALLCDILRARGFQTQVGTAAQTSWNGSQLFFEQSPVSFIVNRSTDFLWQSPAFSALRAAHEKGLVYAAPNPFTYSTRSGKRLLEWLSFPHWDEELGIKPSERQLLSAHVPETHLLRPENLDWLAEHKDSFVFKPAHGFAGHGLLDSAHAGRARLRRLLKQGESYVAQRRVPKASIDFDGVPLWTDLRVWACRGEIFLISGRASRREERLDLAPPGGWLPTYVSL